MRSQRPVLSTLKLYAGRYRMVTCTLLSMMPAAMA